MQHETRITLKIVSASGRLTLGKRYSGRHFEVEECVNGELVLHPVRLVPDTVAPGRTKPGRAPAFQIAEVGQVVLPPPDQRDGFGNNLHTRSGPAMHSQVDEPRVEECKGQRITRSAP